MKDTVNNTTAFLKPKILIIDDSATDREMLMIMLEEHECDFIELSSGMQYLETIATQNPDLILLDIMMPDINGNQMLQEIRKIYTQINLPVIMVTSKVDASDVIDSLKMGANDYITKPVQFDIAFRRVQTHLTIAMQAKTVSQAKELEGIHAMIATYNHEINNPLTIALGNLSGIKKQYGEDPKIAKLENALWRISEIIKSTNLVLQKNSIEYEKYSKSSKMLNLK